MQVSVDADGSSVFKWALVSLLITLTISPLLYFQAHIPVEQTVSYLWNEVRPCRFDDGHA